MNDRGSWEVLDDTGQRLFHGDKLRAQGYARRRCADGGGTVTVVSRTGEQLTEYAVAPAVEQQRGRGIFSARTRRDRRR
ncbi:hypothetical protein ACQE98_00360 [Ornithinimicrobium sp. W1679]|uniref:hypothetical protein n=1 Tax=Ornithinimicrobium sp. W1679 TaxID=3418770 RepID=UPI003CFA808F